MSGNDRPSPRRRGRAFALRSAAVALAAAITVGGVAGTAEARPNNCAGLRKAVTSSYLNYQHYLAGGWHAEANWWYGVYQDARDNYYDTCVSAN